MAAITPHDPVAGEICAALGPKRVISFHLIMEPGEIVRIEAKYYPDKEDLKKLMPILKKYELKETE